MNTVMELIEKQGFDCVGTCAASDLKVLEEVRHMCEADRCHKYGKTWACPPGCGDIHDIERQMHEYSYCAVVQSVGQLEDEFDGETIIETSAKQNERFYKLLVDCSVQELQDVHVSRRAMPVPGQTVRIDVGFRGACC